jgi:hypothetical protein
MTKKIAAILIRDPDRIGTTLPLVEHMHNDGCRFELFFIGFGPCQLAESDLARLGRLQERGIVLYTDAPEGGLRDGVCRIDNQAIAGHLHRADAVIPL